MWWTASLFPKEKAKLQNSTPTQGPIVGIGVSYGYHTVLSKEYLILIHQSIVFVASARSPPCHKVFDVGFRFFRFRLVQVRGIPPSEIFCIN